MASKTSSGGKQSFGVSFQSNYCFLVALMALEGVPIVLLNTRLDTAITGMNSCRGNSLKHKKNIKLVLKLKATQKMNV